MFNPVNAAGHAEKEIELPCRGMNCVTILKSHINGSEYMTLFPIVSNLITSDNKKGNNSLVRLTITFKYDNPKTKEMIIENLPLLLDSFIEFFTSSLDVDMMKPRSIEFIKSSLMSRTNLIIDPYHVSDILIENITIR